MDESVRCPICGTSMDVADSACRNCGASPPSARTVKMSDDGIVLEESDQFVSELRALIAPELVLLHKIGQGGMGTVYLARDPALKRLVVVKVLSAALAADPDARKRFKREGEAAAAVSHPNVVAVHRVGELESKGTDFLVMEFVDGETLDDAIPEGEAVGGARAQRVVAEVALALVAAHQRGVVHRDIKPSNIMIDKETGRAMVLDFGISAAISKDASAQRTKLTVSGMTLGTPLYMSPEQAAGEKIGTATDVYSLGVLAYRLATGRHPFEGDNPMKLIAAHITNVPQPVATLAPDVDPTFGKLIDRALSKDPEARPSALDFANTLRESLVKRTEWPPPGMESLRALASGVIQKQRRPLLVLFVLTLLLAIPPGASGWGPELLRSVAGTLGLLIVVLVAAAVIRQGGFSHRVWWAWRSGYPLKVSLDVGLDNREHTARIIDGVGEFALLNELQRKNILGRRRWGAVAETFGAFITFFAWVAWFLGWIEWPVPDSGAAIRLIDGCKLLGPAIAGGIVAKGLGVRESNLVSTGPKKVRFNRFRSPPLVRNELVRTWLSDVDLEGPSLKSKTGIRILRHLFDSAYSGVLMLMAVLALMSSMAVTFGGERSSITLSDWSENVDQDALMQNWTQLDSITSAVTASLEKLSEPSLTEALTLLRVAGVRPGEYTGLLSWVVLEVDSATLAARRAWEMWIDSALVNGGWRTAGMRWRPGMADTLAMYAANEALHSFRDVARSPPLPSEWFIAEDSDELLLRGMARHLKIFVRHARRNSIAALVALNKGTPRAAVVRAREIIAVGAILARDPHPAAHDVGLEIIGIGSATFFDIGTFLGDEDLIDQADAINAALRKRLDDVELIRQAVYHAANPVAPIFQELIANRRLHATDRWTIFAALGIGACQSRKELISGVLEQRYESLEIGLGSLGDVERSERWNRALYVWMEDWDAAFVGGGRDASLPMRFVAFLGGWVFRSLACPRL